MQTLEGTISKWTNVIKGWQLRWFVLDDQTGILSYYTGAHVGIDNENDVTFTIKVDDKAFHLQAKNLDEREKWVSKIEESIELHTSSYLIRDNNNMCLTVDETRLFDQYLTESDVYMQLLTDHVAKLESNRNAMMIASDEENDIQVVSKYNMVIDSVHNFIDTIKNGIVCLQIAKANRDPNNGGLLNTAQELKDILSKLNKAQEEFNKSQTEALSGTNTSAHNEQSERRISTGQMVVPAHEYSSSDDENFYDANDETSSLSSIKRKALNDKLDELISDVKVGNDQTNGTMHMDLQAIESSASIKINYDEILYDNTDDDNEEIDLNSQQSVITHLLSQVRIGMDLSKITLPTFILERRSLLEMYADFFQQTHLFLQIPDIEHPRERLMQVVKWYLSAFHAGRKSPVAKKPYNPVLGEIFQCWYTIPNLADDNVTVNDGPVPWSTRNQVTFIAEQVSHHPPISAFYAESYNKRIQLDGFIWTKSKFLGLSIGVHMVGKGVIRLLERDEEYVFTFPSGYGRSILTVPWFEMGGKITINCAKTGYSADIEFLTKPFYSGKRNQLQGNIYAPDRKVLYTMDGEWNGMVYLKSSKKTEQFINPSEMQSTIVKKQVRPINEQEEFESRRLWKDVTFHLKTKQIDNATMAKQKIEQKQRDDAKHRKENNIKWQPRYFHEQQQGSDNWVFIRPLVKRLNESSNTANQQ